MPNTYNWLIILSARLNRKFRKDRYILINLPNLPIDYRTTGHPNFGLYWYHFSFPDGTVAKTLQINILRHTRSKIMMPEGYI